MKFGIITWYEALTEYKLKSAGSLATSTYYTQVTTLERYTSVWNQKNLTDFNADFIKSAISQKMESNSANTKNNLAKYIRNVFEMQIGLGRIQFNPGRGIKFDDSGLRYKKLYAMSRDEIVHPFESVKDISPDWYLIYRVKYELGLRSGEAYALKKKHLCLTKNRATIIEFFCWKKKVDKVPKNREYRVIPLNQDLRELLEERLSKLSDDDHVLPRVPAWTLGDAAKVLRSFQQQFGIKETNFHSLRASFITHLINANVPIPQIQAMVGHKHMKTTERYIRLNTVHFSSDASSMSMTGICFPLFLQLLERFSSVFV